MPAYLPLILGIPVAVGLVVWIVGSHQRKRVAHENLLKQLGFSSCPDRKQWLEQTVAAMENTRSFRYEVVEPKCLPDQPAVYHFVKRRHGDTHDDLFAEEEMLFAVKRRAEEGLVLVVKPSALAPGLATRMLGAIATGPSDTQPDDLRPLDIPPDLKNTNLVGALGPPGASFYDLIDTSTLSVVQGLGDAGAMVVRFRDGWCAVAGATAQIPFRVDQILVRMRPLL